MRKAFRAGAIKGEVEEGVKEEIQDDQGGVERGVKEEGAVKKEGDFHEANGKRAGNDKEKVREDGVVKDEGHGLEVERTVKEEA